MLLNLNFHAVSEFVLDPYLTDYITANICLTIITFQANDETEFTRAFQLYNMLHKNTLSSDLKFESQTLILESGFNTEYYDNIIVAVSENPIIDAIGPVLMLGYYGDNSNPTDTAKVPNKKGTGSGPQPAKKQNDEFLLYLKNTLLDSLKEPSNKLSNFLEINPLTKDKLRTSIIQIYHWIFKTFFDIKKDNLSGTLTKEGVERIIKIIDENNQGNQDESCQIF